MVVVSVCRHIFICLSPFVLIIIIVLQWSERSRRNEYYNALAVEQRKQHDEFLKSEERAYQAWKKGGGVGKTEAALGAKAVEALKAEAAAMVKVCYCVCALFFSVFAPLAVCYFYFSFFVRFCYCAAAHILLCFCFVSVLQEATH